MHSDVPIYDKPLPELQEHPLFGGQYPVGLMAGGAPLTAPQVPGGDQALRGLLTQQGLKFEETDGRYGQPERSFIVHGPSREQMFHLGKALGQESVIWAPKGHATAELMYTNGPNAGKSHPAHPQYGFHPTEPPPDYYTKLPGKGYVRLHFDQDRLNPVQLPAQPQAPQPMAKQPEMAKAEPLAKRSKNVREQTRNITPVQAMKRRIQYSQSIGLKPKATEDRKDGFPAAARNQVPYSGNFGIEHETAHAMMTPQGQTIRQYQKWLNASADAGKVSQYDDDGNEDDNFEGSNQFHYEGLHDETIANQLENLTDRRAGVGSNMASKFRSVASPDDGDPVADDLDDEATERATDFSRQHRYKTVGTRTPGNRTRTMLNSQVSIPTQDVRNEAAGYVEPFDRGQKFDRYGRKVEPSGIDSKINESAAYGLRGDGRARLRKLMAESRERAAKKVGV